VVQRVDDLESDEFLLSWQLDRFCIHVDFKRFLSKRFLYKGAEKLKRLVVCNSFWWPEAEKSPNKQG
jgi:hypothetical protein